MAGKEREARLRSEYVPLYPGWPADEWVSAAAATSYVLAQRCAARGGAAVPTDRLLPEEHFEFRGGHSRRSTEAWGRSRLTDRRPLAGIAELLQRS